MNHLLKLRTVAAFLLALVLLVAGCGQQASNNTGGQSGTGSEEGVIKVGAALPLTGDLAPQGKDQRDGYEIWVKTVNDLGGIEIEGKKYKVELVVEDYASDTNTAVKLAEKLITQDKVNFLLGPYGSASIMAVAPIAEKYRVIHMAPTGASEKIYSQGYKYTFGTLSSSEAAFARPWVEGVLAKDPTVKKIAILARNDLYPLDVAETVKRIAEEKGLEVVYFGSYPIATKDLSAPLSEVKRSNPDVFFFSGYANDAMLAIRQSKQIGLYVKAFGATAGLTTPDFLEGMKEAANNITSVETWTPTIPDTYRDDQFGTAADYAKKYQEMFGYVPPYTAASSTVSGYVLQKAIERAQSLDPTKVREEIAKFDENTFYGHVKFNENGQNVAPGFMIQIEYPDLHVIWPEEAKTHEFVYPLPKN